MMMKYTIIALSLSLGACHFNPDATSAVGPFETSQITPTIDIFYPTDKVLLTTDQRTRLRDFFAVWRGSEIAQISIDGHADNRASDIYNLELSSRRVSSIRTELKAYIPDDVRVVSSSFGEFQSNHEGQGSEAWAGNRRVTVKLWLNPMEANACQPLIDRNPKINDGLENLGCSNRTNLEGMLALPLPNPDQIILGDPDPTQAAEAVVRYRAGEVKTPESGEAQ